MSRSLTISIQSISDRLFDVVTSVPAKYNAAPLEEFVNGIPQFSNVDFDLKEDFTGFYQQFLQGRVKQDFDQLKSIHPQLLTRKNGWRRVDGKVNRWLFNHHRRITNKMRRRRNDHSSHRAVLSI